MPVVVSKINGRWRVTEGDLKTIATNRAGTALDGGGHDSKEKAAAQARAVNASLKKEGKI